MCRAKLTREDPPSPRPIARNRMDKCGPTEHSTSTDYFSFRADLSNVDFGANRTPCPWQWQPPYSCPTPKDYILLRKRRKDRGGNSWDVGATVITADDSDLSWVRSKFLVGLSDEALRQLLDTAQMRHIAAGKDVIVSGDQPDHLFLLKTGQARSYIRTEDGREIVLLWAVPGEVIGLATLLPNPPNYMASTTTVTACDWLVWNHDTIRKLAAEYPQIMENGFRLALHYCRTCMDRHVNVMTKSAESRLAHQLIQLATSVGKIGNSGIEIDISHEQFSSLSDVDPFTTSRVLSNWEKKRVLSKQSGRLTIHAPESLMLYTLGLEM
jgi:CRP-like cAMP-binding protein